MAIKKSDLYASLWASCDELRGGMDASQYKDYVLFMLFIKYVSDKYADSDAFAPPVVIPQGASFRDMIALKGKPDIGDRINTQIIQPLIEANTRLARSDFPDFNDANKLGEGDAMVKRLDNLIGIFESPALNFSGVNQLFDRWKAASAPHLKNFDRDGHPKELIEHIAEDLLASFKTAPLLDGYDVYQHLMDYWTATMQDDAYVIAADGWQAGVQPREIRQLRNKDNKLVWPEAEDYRIGKRRYKSDLIPAALLIKRYFNSEQQAIEALEATLAGTDQQLDELREENSGEDGLLAEVIEGEGDKQKITAKAIKARLKEIGQDSDYADERKALQDYSALLQKQAETKAALKAANEELHAKLHAQYPTLSVDEIKALVVDDKWLATLATSVQNELDRVSQTLTARIRQLAERYATPLPKLAAEVETLAARVDEHLRKMGAVWS